MRKSTMIIALFAAISMGSVMAEETTAAANAEWDPAKLQTAMAKVKTGDAGEGKRLHDYLYCSACHGITGESPSRNWPSLTGQKADYVMKSLLDYRENMRRDNYRKADLMLRIAKLLSDEDIAHLAAYYSSHEAPRVAPTTDLELAKQGEQLANSGDMTRGVLACTTCHGASGESGVTPETSALAGQTPDYFTLAMKMYRDGMRSSDVGGVMRNLSKSLTDDEIAALAHYYASKGAAR